MDIAQLPYIDEHTTDIAADAADVWPELLEGIERSFSHRGGGALRPGDRLRRHDRRRTATIRSRARPSPASASTALDPAVRAGARGPPPVLVLRVVLPRSRRSGSARPRLHAETRAAFPGSAGRAYRLLVIGTGGHVVAVRRLLSGITRRAEARPTRLTHSGPDRRRALSRGCAST